MKMTERSAFALFRLTLLLLFFSVCATLVTGVKFTSDDPLASVFPYPSTAGMAAALVSGALISGLLGGGILIANDNFQSMPSPRGRTGVTLWGILAVALPLAWLFDLPPTLLIALEAARGIIIVIWGIWMVSGSATRPNGFESALRWVWTTGVMCIGGGLVLGSLSPILAPDDFLRQTALFVFGRAFYLHIGLPVTAIALAFWLMHRVSNVTPAWAARGVLVCAGLLALAGIWITLPALYPLGASEFVRTVGSLGIVIAPAALIIVASHSYRALSDRNPTATLAGHWLALGVLLMLFAVGVVGGLQTLPALTRWTAGTRLAELQTSWIQAAAAAVILGMINQAGAAARGWNARVTGLLPFWLIAAGWLGGGLALGIAGVAQVYMERVLSVGYLETQSLIVPFHELWLFGWLSAAVGVGVYAAAIAVRRPFVERLNVRG